jgi:hypothetical protein
VGEIGNAYNNLLENPKGRDHYDNLDVDGKIILELILGKECWKLWSGHICLGIGTSGVPCEYGNEASESIKSEELLDQLSNYYLLQEDSAPWN